MNKKVFYLIVAFSMLTFKANAYLYLAFFAHVDINTIRDTDGDGKADKWDCADNGAWCFGMTKFEQNSDDIDVNLSQMTATVTVKNYISRDKLPLTMSDNKINFTTNAYLAPDLIEDLNLPSGSYYVPIGQYSYNITGNDLVVKFNIARD